jgi:hypothetical protein
VRVFSSWGAQDESDVDVTIASNIHVTSPNTAAGRRIGSSLPITWTHAYGATETFDIDFSADGGVTWTSLALYVPATSATSGSYTWKVAGDLTTQALIRVSPTGRAGDGDTSDVMFSVLPPRIVP